MAVRQFLVVVGFTKQRQTNWHMPDEKETLNVAQNDAEVMTATATSRLIENSRLPNIRSITRTAKSPSSLPKLPQRT
jgi:hypothetical protein